MPCPRGCAQCALPPRRRNLHVLPQRCCPSHGHTPRVFLCRRLSHHCPLCGRDSHVFLSRRCHGPFLAQSINHASFPRAAAHCDTIILTATQQDKQPGQAADGEGQDNQRAVKDQERQTERDRENSCQDRKHCS